MRLKLKQPCTKREHLAARDRLVWRPWQGRVHFYKGSVVGSGCTGLWNPVRDTWASLDQRERLWGQTNETRVGHQQVSSLV